MKIKIKVRLRIKNFFKITTKYEKKKLIDTDFNTKPTYGDDDKYIKTKIKIYEDNMTTNSYNKKRSKNVPKETTSHEYLSIIILDSVLYEYEKYHPHIFSECKYAEENIKTRNYVDKELKSESDSDSE